MPRRAIYDENLDLARVETKLIKPSRGADGAPKTGESGTKHENPLHCSNNPFVGIRMSSNKIARLPRPTNPAPHGHNFANRSRNCFSARAAVQGVM